jgi:hypothetical protein
MKTLRGNLEHAAKVIVLPILFRGAWPHSFPCKESEEIAGSSQVGTPETLRQEKIQRPAIDFHAEDIVTARFSTTSPNPVD